MIEVRSVRSLRLHLNIVKLHQILEKSSNSSKIGYDAMQIVTWL